MRKQFDHPLNNIRIWSVQSLNQFYLLHQTLPQQSFHQVHQGDIIIFHEVYQLQNDFVMPIFSNSLLLNYEQIPQISYLIPSFDYTEY